MPFRLVQYYYRPPLTIILPSSFTPFGSVSILFSVCQASGHFQSTIMSINDALIFLFKGYTPSVILAVLGVLFIIRQRLAIQLGPQEPPILKPRIPYIGHIIGLLRHHSAYFDKLWYAVLSWCHGVHLTIAALGNRCQLQPYL